MPVKEARFYEQLADGLVRCTICPRRCVIKPGERGFCGTRENRDGRLYTLIYGELSASAVDPIEKKPLFHFEPGSLTFSISTVGCSFKCPWCQNYHISQARPEEYRTVSTSPEDVIRLAKRYECPSISITYNEPIIWLEFVEDVGKLAKAEGLEVVLVTNGYISLEALDAVAGLIDAANVDIKAFDPGFYRRYCKGDLESVLQATVAMLEKGIHVETTLLIIPGLNDKEEELRAFCKWHYENLGPDTPLHISRFFPAYKMLYKEATPISTLQKAYDIAKEAGLSYVYVGNLPGNPGEHTYCPGCGRPVIKRHGFEIADWALDDEMRCEECGTRIPIRGRFHKRGRWSPFLIY